MKIVVCVDGFAGDDAKSASKKDYGGAGYRAGLIADLDTRASDNCHVFDVATPNSVLWSIDFVGKCGVYKKALRNATPNEIEEYKKGIRNIKDMTKKFTINFISNGVNEKVDIFNTSQENALKVLDKMLSTENRKLDGINYILEE